MVHKLLEVTSKNWRLLNGTSLLTKVIAGVRFIDRVELIDAARHNHRPQRLTIAHFWTLRGQECMTQCVRRGGATSIRGRTQPPDERSLPEILLGFAGNSFHLSPVCRHMHRLA